MHHLPFTIKMQSEASLWEGGGTPPLPHSKDPQKGSEIVPLHTSLPQLWNFYRPSLAKIKSMAIGPCGIKMHVKSQIVFL